MKIICILCTASEQISREELDATCETNLCNSCRQIKARLDLQDYVLLEGGMYNLVTSKTYAETQRFPLVTIGPLVTKVYLEPFASLPACLTDAYPDTATRLHCVYAGDQIDNVLTGQAMATARLLEGVTIFAQAAHMGTSPEMVWELERGNRKWSEAKARTYLDALADAARKVTAS